MKVVFLDFDGVLNSEDWRLWRPTDDMSILGLAPPLVARLNDIVGRSAAKVVISSSWRLLCDLPELQTRLADKGFTGEVIDQTPHYLGVGTQRGDEIRDWINRHPEVEAFVVLDDSCDMHTVEDHHVPVDPMVGLQDADVWMALNILGIGSPES